MYLLNNVVDNGEGNLQFTTIGIYLPEPGSWQLSLQNAIYRDGSNKIPSDVEIPTANRNYLPQWAKVLGYLEASIVFFTCLIALRWLYVDRRRLVVIQSQPVFMQLIVLGLAMIGASIIPLTIEDSDSSCMAYPFLFSIGVTFITTSLSIKSLRVGRLWYGFAGRKQKTERGIVYLAIVLLIVWIDFCIILAWDLTAPLVYGLTVTQVDVNGYPLSLYGSCLESSQASIVFLGVDVAFIAILVVVTGLLSVWVQNAPAQFQDAKMTAIGAVALAQVYLLGVPIVVISYSIPLSRFLVLSTLCFLTAEVLFCILFLPKMLVKDRDRESRSVSLGTSPVLDRQYTKKFKMFQIGVTGAAAPGVATSVRRTAKPASPQQSVNKRLDEEGDIRSRAKAHRSDFAPETPLHAVVANKNKTNRFEEDTLQPPVGENNRRNNCNLREFTEEDAVEKDIEPFVDPDIYFEDDSVSTNHNSNNNSLPTNETLRKKNQMVIFSARERFSDDTEFAPRESRQDDRTSHRSITQSPMNRSKSPIGYQEKTVTASPVAAGGVNTTIPQASSMLTLQ